LELTAIVILLLILALGLVTVSLFTKFLAVSRENEQRYESIMARLDGVLKTGQEPSRAPAGEKPSEQEEEP